MSIKVDGKFTTEFPVNKGLCQGCSLAPLLFKIYLEGVLRYWKRKCSTMGLRVGDEHIYTLLFADDQVLIAADKDDTSYMVRKLSEEFLKWGLKINLTKTEYLVTGENNDEDLDIETTKIKHCKQFKYLGVTITSNGKSTEDINNKICQGKRVIRQLNTVLWNNKITKRTKTTIYKAILESVCTYGCETWELTKRDKDKLLALEMDFWRRSSGISRTEHVRNGQVREIMQTQGDIIDTIETKRLLWYGHLERMHDSRWPKRIWRWTPPERRKRGRPARSWKLEVDEAMTARGLQEGDWQDRKKWRLGSERRRQP